jgi:hypothetical protein
LEDLRVQVVGWVSAVTETISASIIAFGVAHAAILTLALAFPTGKSDAARRLDPLETKCRND